MALACYMLSVRYSDESGCVLLDKHDEREEYLQKLKCAD